MAKKGKKPVKTCADCIHEFACSMWNIGYIHNMDATNCTNHETIKDSSSYFIGFSDGQESKPLNGWISVQDRLPEAGGYVVCIAKRNPFSRFMPMVARIEKNGWVNPITEQYISEVTHWQPMPEQPGMEKMEG